MMAFAICGTAEHYAKMPSKTVKYECLARVSIKMFVYKSVKKACQVRMSDKGVK